MKQVQFANLVCKLWEERFGEGVRGKDDDESVCELEVDKDGECDL